MHHVARWKAKQTTRDLANSKQPGCYSTTANKVTLKELGVLPKAKTPNLFNI